MNAELIDRHQAAEYLGISPGTLANWQCTGFRKVPHVKIGRRVRYRKADLERFVEANLVDALPGDVNSLDD